MGSTPYPGAPRWVKAWGIILMMGVLLFITVHVLSGDGLSGLIDHGIHDRTSVPTVTDRGAHRP
jgi:hypothetical protein